MDKELTAEEEDEWIEELTFLFGDPETSTRLFFNDIARQQRCGFENGKLRGSLKRKHKEDSPPRKGTTHRRRKSSSGFDFRKLKFVSCDGPETVTRENHYFECGLCYHLVACKKASRVHIFALRLMKLVSQAQSSRS